MSVRRRSHSQSPSLSASPQPKRKVLALMEMVSYGTPQKLFAREGECHRVSPQAKRHLQLHAKQVGITKTLLCNSEVSSSEVRNLDPAMLTTLRSLVKSAVEEALQEQTEKLEKEILAKLRNDLGITIRSLISDWLKCSSGKAALEMLTKALNKAFADKNHQHRVMTNDVLKEVKRLIRSVEANDVDSEKAKELLLVVEDAVQESLCIPGDEFVNLVMCYVHTNQQVHIKWSQEELQDVVNKAKKGELEAGSEKRTTWINRMTSDIASARGWQINF